MASQRVCLTSPFFLFEAFVWIKGMLVVPVPQAVSLPAESLLDQMEARTGLALGASAEPSRMGSPAVFLLL